MPVKQDSRKKLLTELEDARSKHRRLAKKLEATQGKLEKRTRKLCALESKIAKLEQRAHELTTAPHKRAPKNSQSLRAARERGDRHPARG